ncbi:MAG: NAD(P)H-dependent oxidoreductase [Desulfovibrio sp.]|jgi:nitroreductase|nr:NAD(P)H-dependent oxidoreductase [Desulfovibrio sp.]
MKQKILDAFNFRHACKEFDPEKRISDEDFAFILETARLSPSSFGFEPWHFLIVQDMKVREKLAEHCWGGKKQFPTASHLVIGLVKKGCFMRWDSEYVQDFMRYVQELPEDIVKMKGDFFRKFEEEDFDLLCSDRALVDWATHQAYLPLANMMTAAALIGIDSCPMEGFHKKSMEAALHRELGIDLDKYTMAYAVAFGHRKNDPRPKTRRPMDAITTWIKGD